MKETKRVAATEKASQLTSSGLDIYSWVLHSETAWRCCIGSRL